MRDNVELDIARGEINVARSFCCSNVWKRRFNHFKDIDEHICRNIYIYLTVKSLPEFDLM